MANKKYEQGKRAEYKVRKTLENEGYTCFRSAGSKGLFDVIAINSCEVRLIQVKFTEKDKYTEDKNCKLAKNLGVPENTKKELWIFYSYRGHEIRELKEEE